MIPTYYDVLHELEDIITYGYIVVTRSVTALQPSTSYKLRLIKQGGLAKKCEEG